MRARGRLRNRVQVRGKPDALGPISCDYWGVTPAARCGRDGLRGRGGSMARMSFAYILSVLMVAVAACSGGDRGATPTKSSAHDAGAPRATVALITHQAPGDTFWDLVRRGAEAAATKDDIDLQYSRRPGRGGPGQPHAVGGQRKGRRDRCHARRSRGHGAGRAERSRRANSGCGREFRDRRLESTRGDGVFRTRRDDRRSGRGGTFHARRRAEHAVRDSRARSRRTRGSM